MDLLEMREQGFYRIKTTPSPPAHRRGSEDVRLVFRYEDVGFAPDWRRRIADMRPAQEILVGHREILVTD
jgi:hypothetical protein